MPLPIKQLSIIIPVYNEKETLEKTVDSCSPLIGNFTETLQIILVDDGSQDGSGDICDRLALKNSQVQVIHHPVNRGIGEAINTGYSHALGDWITLIPADLQFHPRDLMVGKPYIEDHDIICFYRSPRKDIGFLRKMVSFTNQLLNRILFSLKIRDVNWVKLFKAWTVKKINTSSHSPFVESERLILTQRAGARIVEIHAPHQPRKVGKALGAKLSTVFSSFKDLLHFFWKLYFFPKKRRIQ